MTVESNRPLFKGEERELRAEKRGLIAEGHKEKIITLFTGITEDLNKIREKVWLNATKKSPKEVFGDETSSFLTDESRVGKMWLICKTDSLSLSSQKKDWGLAVSYEISEVGWGNSGYFLTTAPDRFWETHIEETKNSKKIYYEIPRIDSETGKSVNRGTMISLKKYRNFLESSPFEIPGYVFHSKDRQITIEAFQLDGFQLSEQAEELMKKPSDKVNQRTLNKLAYMAKYVDSPSLASGYSPKELIENAKKVVGLKPY